MRNKFLKMSKIEGFSLKFNTITFIYIGKHSFNAKKI
jgi:hypothetical protein